MKTVARTNNLASAAFHYFLGFHFMNDTNSNKCMMNIFHQTITVITINPRALLYPQLYNKELVMSKCLLNE